MTNIGDVVLVQISPTGPGTRRFRPALVLASLPGTVQTLLVCGLSTRTADALPGWDEIVDPAEHRFAEMGLKRRCAVRLGYLTAISENDVAGRIGAAPRADVDRFRRRLRSRLG